LCADWDSNPDILVRPFCCADGGYLDFSTKEKEVVECNEMGGRREWFRRAEWGMGAFARSAEWSGVTLAAQR